MVCVCMVKRPVQTSNVCKLSVSVVWRLRLICSRRLSVSVRCFYCVFSLESARLFSVESFFSRIGVFCSVYCVLCWCFEVTL